MVHGMWGQVSIALIVFPTVLVPLLIEKWAPFRMPVSLQVQYALLLVLGTLHRWSTGFIPPVAALGYACPLLFWFFN